MSRASRLAAARLATARAAHEAAFRAASKAAQDATLAWLFTRACAAEEREAAVARYVTLDAADTVARAAYNAADDALCAAEAEHADACERARPYAED
jgi:hypothetical protein